MVVDQMVIALKMNVFANQAIKAQDAKKLFVILIVAPMRNVLMENVFATKDGLEVCAILSLVPMNVITGKYLKNYFRGVCLGGSCICDKNFKGFDCSEKICINDCSGHGKCNSQKRCECDSGYRKLYFLKDSLMLIAPRNYVKIIVIIMDIVMMVNVSVKMVINIYINHI